MKHLLLVWVVCVGLAQVCLFAESRPVLSLAGSWRLRLDPDDQGARGNWAAGPLQAETSILLPNTLDLAGLGFALDTNTMSHPRPFPGTTRFPAVKDPVQADQHGYLVRRHLYVGPAWYERDIEIPADWNDRSVVFTIERAMWRTDVWLDGRHFGSCDSLVAEHTYDLGVLVPGRHRLTVSVDNRLAHNISTITHAYGPETQSRWNGMVGKICLTALNVVSVRSVAVHPAPDRLSARLNIALANSSGKELAGILRAKLLREQGGPELSAGSVELVCPVGGSTNGITLKLETPAAAWDEFSTSRYAVKISFESEGRILDESKTDFGFRNIARVGKELRLNGRRIFLRGTLDCCVYPKTGHPPVSITEWERVLAIIKQYGFNHVRYHTWCPPDAAFEAADRLGLYLQPEVPAWVDDWVANTVTKPKGIGRDPDVLSYLKTEIHRIIEAYGNHPSFLMFTIGNEFGENVTDWPVVNDLVEEIKNLDPRRLYSGCTARRHLAADDYWVTHDTRAPTRGVGPAGTDWDFSKAAEASPVPVIAHETGQRPVFPDYDALLPKFTGPLLPLNLERYRRELETSGLMSQVPDFVRGSAKFQLTQYKAEHEGMLRTRGFSGYQLLMLNDFTGQSEALVGVLDPFWDSKGVVSVEDIRRWNAPIVVLARFAKYVWSSDEEFRAEIEVAHFGPRDIVNGVLDWSLITAPGKVVARAQRQGLAGPAGGLAKLGSIAVPLSAIKEPAAVTLRVSFAGTENRWNLWVYPRIQAEPEPAGVLVVKLLDPNALAALRTGGKVLLLAHGLKNSHAARTGFESVYWSAGWWGNKFSSLGLICDVAHPSLAEFPNEGRSDWQWRELCLGATAFSLDGLPVSVRPIVQPIPDFHFNSRLATLFEARIGSGSLVVCGYELTTNLENRPAARQLRRSLFRYLASPSFAPVPEMPLSWAENMFAPRGLQRSGAIVFNADSEDVANGNVAPNVIDGDPDTFWHTRWQPSVDPLPHELTVDLGRVVTLKGIVYYPRRNQSNGRIADAEVYCAKDNRDFGKPVAVVRWLNNDEPQQVMFKEPVEARFLKVVARSEVNGDSFTAIADLEIVQ